MSLMLEKRELKINFCLSVVIESRKIALYVYQKLTSALTTLHNRDCTTIMGVVSFTQNKAFKHIFYKPERKQTLPLYRLELFQILWKLLWSCHACYIFNCRLQQGALGSICPQWRTAALWWLGRGSGRGCREYLEDGTTDITQDQQEARWMRRLYTLKVTKQLNSN